MRIGLFHCDLPCHDRKAGGVPVAVHRLGNALAADPRDHVLVFSLDHAPADAAYQHVRLFDGAAWLATRKLARMVLLPAALNFADFRGVDVLHLHGDDWFFVRRRPPSVRTLHGSALREAQSAGASAKRRLAQHAMFRLERLAARLADVCLAVGDDARRLYHADAIIDNGVDLGVFCPGHKSPEPLVLFVGTWTGRKRGEFLARQFREVVLPAVPSARLVMVSDHCEPGPGVEWRQRPGDAELADLYRRAWAFAYPSVYEGFGMSYLEAMASGTAVLTSPNPGASHVLDGGRAGLIAPDDTFALTLCRLLGDESLRRDYEARGLVRARQFSWAAVAREHRKIYQTLVAARAAGRTGH